MRLKYPLFILYFLLFHPHFSFGQTKVVKIIDAQTKEPIPFVHIQSPSFSWEANMNGVAHINLPTNQNDTLCFSFNGYERLCLIADSLKPSPFVNTIPLKIEIIKSDKITISLGINPAHKWIQLAINNSENNNPNRYSDHSKLIHTRMLVGLQEINSPVISKDLKRSLNALSDTFQLMEDSNQLHFVPVFHSQTLSRMFHQKHPLKEQELVLGSRVDGVGVDNGDFISQLTGTALFTYNIYNPVMTFLEKGIPSPISNIGFNTYQYHLVDVKKTNKLREFIIEVHPKNAGDVAFSGMIWIQEKTGLVTRLILNLNGASNINFIESLKIIQDFNSLTTGPALQQLNEGKIAIELENFENSAAKVIGFNETKVLDVRPEPHISDSFSLNRIRLGSNSLQQDNPLFDAEQNQTYDSILSRINAVKELPQIKRGVTLVNILVDGYYGGNLPIEFGPYYMLGSYNPLEGFRTRLGFRTSWRLSQKWQWESFIGYGFRDERYKYGLKFSWHPNFDRGTYLKLSHAQDVELIGFSDNDAITSGDALNTALNMIASPSVSYCQSAKIEVGTDLAQGLSLSTIVSHRKYSLPESQRLQLAWYDSLPGTHLGSNLNNATATIQLRYEPRVFYLNWRNRRQAMSPAGPVYTLSFMQGIPGILGSEYQYQRLSLQWEERKVWGPIGKTNIKVRGSKVWGTVPFPLLDIPLGNQAPVLNNRAFNQMQLFEFVSDQTIQAQFEHHFNGYFFNRVPLLCKLKWREVIHAKAIYGTLREENRAFIPRDLNGLNRSRSIGDYQREPYIEAGFGIANIYRFFRIDAIWRITHRDHFPKRNFGIMGSAFLKF